MSGAKALIARILLESPLPQLDHLFDYEVPEALINTIRVGQKVRVPFRSRQKGITGYVVELTDSSDFKGKLAQLTEIISPVALLKENIWKLARALADRAGGSAGDILRLAIPPRQVRVEKTFLAEQEKIKQDQASSKPQSTSQQTSKTFHTVEAEQIAEELLQGARIHLDVAGAPVRLATGEWVLKWAHIFSDLARALQTKGNSVIIVVPDFRDVDQVCDTLQTLGAENILRFDSRLSNAKRYKHFLQALQSQSSIVVGNRSSVYAPVHNLGAILMWDEADESLIEPLAPYVHPRDAALMRAANESRGLLFASHTRTTQMQRLIEMNYLKPVSAKTKQARVIHTGSLIGAEEEIGRIPTFAYKTITEQLQKGPVLVQVSSPGFSPAMVCSNCQDRAKCNNCTGPLQSTLKGGIRCRLCLQSGHNWRCPNCRNETMLALGAGSERTAEQLAKAFPETEVILSDGAHKRTHVDARPNLVVATRGAEPIAAGGYRAVVILDVERVLSSWHLHAGEDALRWWRGAQAHAGEDATCVLVGGGGITVDAFVRDGDELWAKQELLDRVELRFPPAVRIASLMGEKQSIQKSLTSLKDIPGTDYLGPTKMSDGSFRAIVRFEYTQGTAVAKSLRAELLREISENSAKRYMQQKNRDSFNKPKVSLRLKFDDQSVFDERGQSVEEGV